MKKFLFLFLALLSTASTEAKQVECRSENTAPIVGGKTGLWKMSFDLYAESDYLRNFSLSTSKKRDAGGEAAFQEYDKLHRLKDRTHNLYYMTDPWCAYEILLPKKISELEGTYKSKVSFQCENEKAASFEMTCVRTDD